MVETCREYIIAFDVKVLNVRSEQAESVGFEDVIIIKYGGRPFRTARSLNDQFLLVAFFDPRKGFHVSDGRSERLSVVVSDEDLQKNV